MTDIIKAPKDKPIFNKYKLLLLSILFDIIGLASYIIPGAGEIVDLFWAPLSAILLYRMYPGNIGKVASIIGFIEGIIYLTKSDEDFYNMYQVGRKPWF